VAKAETTIWPDEQTAVMRGMFGNLVYEARRIQEDVFDQLDACASCSHLFDIRDERCHRDEHGSWCPACNMESLQKMQTEK
jgi:hypothetical protein